jgi:hypothetical protein
MPPVPRVGGSSRNLPRTGLTGTPLAQGSAMGHPKNAATRSPGTNEVYSLSVSGTPTAGTFTLRTVAESGNIDVTTAAIAYNANNATLQAALDAVLGAGNSVVTAGPLPAATTITFTGNLAGQTVTMTVASSVTGGTAAASNTTDGVGGAEGIGDPSRRFGSPGGTRSSQMARPRPLGR